jgi:signal transduction histidine kinase
VVDNRFAASDHPAVRRLLHLKKRCLFEAFYTTKPGGLGIARSIRRSIMDSHRDWLWATANPDHGATFHVA